MSASVPQTIFHTTETHDSDSSDPFENFTLVKRAPHYDFSRDFPDSIESQGSLECVHCDRKITYRKNRNAIHIQNNSRIEYFGKAPPTDSSSSEFEMDLNLKNIYKKNRNKKSPNKKRRRDRLNKKNIQINQEKREYIIIVCTVFLTVIISYIIQNMFHELSSNA